MGLRKKPRSAKAESQVDELQPPVSKGSAAVVHREEHSEDDDYDDKDSDPEMQEVYVQAYACQVFRDDAAAQAVEDGAHLRPLAMPQDSEGGPLMLDRFDARWMLDIADFSKGTGSNIPAALKEEERKADVLRYSGLPNSDHSVFVEGLGTFAPTGSYAHDQQGGLGGDKEELPEVYGYYGRTASPPRAARGAWSSTPAHQTPVDDSEIPSDVVETDRHEKGKGDEGFIPDFAVPAGVLVPSSVRQHLMMVSTARNAVRSPQLEVLLRLKQASNAAFSFLSHEDPIHPYYVFLKSWGEAALAGEYERMQRRQVDKRKEETENAGAEESTAVTAKGIQKSCDYPSLHASGVNLAASSRGETAWRPDHQRFGGCGSSGCLSLVYDYKSSSLVRPPAADDTNSRGAPNLLGGAYDSSGDEKEQESSDEAEASSSTVASPPSTRIAVASDPKRAEAVPVRVGAEEGEREGVSDVAPAKRLVVDKVVAFVSRNGQAFEDRVREREKSNPAFDFLSPTNKYHVYYKKRLAEARGETWVPPTTASSVAQEHSIDVGNPGVSPTRASGVGYRVTADSVERQGVMSEERGSASTRDNGNAGGGMNAVDCSVATASAVTADHAQVTNDNTAQESRVKAELPRSRGRSGGLEAAGDVPALIARSGQPEEAASRSENSDDVGRDQKKLLVEVQPSKAMAHSGVAEEGVATLATSSAGIVDGDGDEDPETRRANRLKRARLMKGHYKLAVLHQSSGGETADEGQQKQRGGSPPNVALLDTRSVPNETKGDVDDLSADGISDLDDDDHDTMDDDDDEDNNENGEEDDYEENKTSPAEAPVAGGVDNRKKKGGQRTSREEAAQEDGHLHRGKREKTELSDKKESRHGASSRRGQRGDKEHRRSRSGSGSRVDGVGRSGDRSYSRGHRKSERNGDDRTGEGRTRHRSSPDRRRKRVQDSGRDRDGGRLDRDESDRRKRRSSRSSERDRKVSGARRGESRERSREVRGDRDGGSRSKGRGGKDRREDEDRDSRERRRKRSRSRERGDSRSKATSSSRRRR